MSTVTAVPLQPVKRRVLVYVWVGVLLAVIAAHALAGQAPRDAAADFLVRNAHETGVVTTASGLQYKVIEPGSGNAHPTDTDIALINYVGTLSNGTTFGKSQQPTPMPVVATDEKTGKQGVVAGFSEALKLMTKGAKYRFWIKPSLGYGDKAAGPIPPHSLLIFDLTLLDWKSEAEIRQMQMMQQMMQQQGGHAAGGAPAAGPPPGAQ